LRSRPFLLGIIVVTVSLVTLGGLLSALGTQPSGSLPASDSAVVLVSITAAPSTPLSATPSPKSDVVAVVNSEPIDRTDWQHSIALDRAMSQLAGQPAPDAEATLQRLINERLVLQQTAARQIVVSDQAAQQRLDFLKQTWQVDEATLDRTLTLNGLSKTDVLADIRRLLIIEAYLKQIATQQDPDQWLAAQRAQAQIGLYTDLAAAAQPAAATAPQPAATPIAAVVARPDLPIGYSVDQQALDFTLNDLAGQPVKLSALRGHVTILNFWATWCPPCRSEVPALQAAYQQYQSRGVALIGIDLKEDAATIQQFVAPYGVTYPIVRDENGGVSAQYQVAGIPTTIIIDANGVIRARHIGPITEAQLAEYVDPLLTASVPAPVAAAHKIAPDFALPRGNGQTIHLSDYRDKATVVLVFYRGQT